MPQHPRDRLGFMTPGHYDANTLHGREASKNPLYFTLPRSIESARAAGAMSGALERGFERLERCAARARGGGVPAKVHSSPWGEIRIVSERRDMCAIVAGESNATRASSTAAFSGGGFVLMCFQGTSARFQGTSARKFDATDSPS